MSWGKELPTSKPLLEGASDERQPQLSPDWRWLAYVSNETGRDEVYVQTFPELGSKRQVSSSGGTDPRWHPEGRELFYRNGNEMMVVDFMMDHALTLGTPGRLFKWSFPEARRWSPPFYDVATDGQRFVMMEPREPGPGVTQLHLFLNWGEELKRLVSEN